MSTFDDNMGGILNPDNAFEYTKISKHLFVYKDSLNNEYFLQLERNNTLRGMEIKIGWLDDKRQRQFEIPFPPNIAVEDNNLRGNTISKILKDEVLPMVVSHGIRLVAKPYDAHRYPFVKRILEKFVDTETCNLVEDENNVFTITKK